MPRLVHAARVVLGVEHVDTAVEQTRVLRVAQPAALSTNTSHLAFSTSEYTNRKKDVGSEGNRILVIDK